MFVETGKDLAQIKDEELKKEKRKKRLLWFSPELTYCVCVSVQCLHVFNAHTQLEGGSAHSVFCSVWVWIKEKHVVPFCSLEHSVKGREKSHLCWYCQQGVILQMPGVGERKRWVKVQTSQSIDVDSGVVSLWGGWVFLWLRLVFDFLFFSVSAIWIPLAICCLWNLGGCSKGILHHYNTKW